jgi:hypothetical protein
VIVAERQLVFSRVQDLAAAGDPAAIHLEAEITSPGQILDTEESTGSTAAPAPGRPSPR